jgi:hypothetical protein
VRSESYTEYGKQRTVAMRCLGYPPEQFQFIAVQPLQLYAFHKPSQKLKPIPDLPASELYKIASPQAIRWHSLRTPLNKTAPLNISTLGQPQDPHYRLQQTLKQLKSHLPENQPEPTTSNLSELTADSPETQALLQLIQNTPQVLQDSTNPLAPHLLCQHLEQTNDACEQWLKVTQMHPQNLELLRATYTTVKHHLNILVGE